MITVIIALVVPFAALLALLKLSDATDKSKGI